MVATGGRKDGVSIWEIRAYGPVEVLSSFLLHEKLRHMLVATYCGLVEKAPLLKLLAHLKKIFRDGPHGNYIAAVIISFGYRSVIALPVSRT